MADKAKKEPTKAELQAAQNAAEIKENGFLNPLSPGVTYEAFYKAMGKESDPKKYLKGKITDNELDCLLVELEKYESN